MPQLSEVATVGPALKNPYAHVPDSIESRAWMLWRAAIGTAQRTGVPIGEEGKFGVSGFVFQTALRSIAKDLFAGVPSDLAAVYAELKDRRNAACIDRGARGITPLWWFRAEYSIDEPIAEVTKLPIEAPAVVGKPAKPVAKKRSAMSRTGLSMTQADQNAAILKVLTTAKHPVYLEEVAAKTKLHATTVRSRVMDLIEGERVFRRLETLDERDGTPGRRHHLYWASAEIPLRPAELFKVTHKGSKASGARPGYIAPARKTVLQRVEALTLDGIVSLSNATQADLAGVQELLNSDVIEFVNTVTKKEVRLATAQTRERNAAPALSRSEPAGTLADNLEALVEIEVQRRVANELVELERRLSDSERVRVEAQTELAALQGRVQSLLG